MRHESSTGPYDFDEQHAILLAGMDYRVREQAEQLAQERVQEILHQRSLEALGMARRYASQKGPFWAAMVCDDEEPWEAAR